jgi:Predicted transcriptional regulator
MPGKSLRLGVLEGDTQRISVLKALASEPRLAILDYLGPQSVPLSQIAKKLGIPSSTAAMHVAALERAGLLRTDMTPASRGLQKVCARTYDEIVVQLPDDESRRGSRIEVGMPVGAYSEFEVEPTCGLASATALIGYLDDPGSFYEPTRFGAQLLWFRRGFVEYRFPNRVPGKSRVTAVQFAAELCSEAPRHNDDYPSDISIWINGVHLGVWTSPGDFGGERGQLTPDWWESADSQYGLLKRWRVTAERTTLDGVRLSNVTLDDLGLAPGEPIRVRLGVSRDADHVGGVNLFGERFGNYSQDLVLIIDYEPLDQHAMMDSVSVIAGLDEG